MTLAEQNKAVCDDLLMDIAADTNIAVYYSTLWTRQITSQNQKELEDAMQYLDGSFNFEVITIFVENAFGYEIQLPRIIVDFDN